MKNKKFSLFLIIIILTINFFLSSYKLGERTFSGDEARIAIKVIWILRGLSNLIHLNINKETFLSFYGIFTHTHAPMVFIIPLPFLLWGINEYAFRLSYILLCSVILVFMYLVIKKETSNKFAFVIGLFLSSSSLLIGWGRWFDVPIIEVFFAGLLVYALYLFSKYKTKFYFYWLMIIYTLSLFTIISFYIYLPLILYYVVRSWNKLSFNTRLKGLLIPISTAGLFYLIWFFITIFYLRGDLGLNYVLFNRLKMAGTLEGTFKYFINNFLLDINIIFWIPFILFGLRLFRRDKLVQISTLYCLFYIICFFILRSEAPYLYHIYLPLIFIGIRGFNFINKNIIFFIYFILSIVNILLMIFLLKGGNNISNLTWSFGYQKNSLKEIGLIVRDCLDAQDRYLTDEDYYITDYYFNRRYPTESDDGKWGREKSILQYKDLNVKAIVLSKSYLESYPYIKSYLMENSVMQKLFFDNKTLFLMKKCSLPDTTNAEKLFDKKYGHLWEIIDFKR